MTATTVSTCGFLSLFFGKEEDICFRAFPPRGVQGAVIKKRGSIHALQNGSGLLQSLYEQNKASGVYFVVNQGGDTDGDIERFNACFAESDHATIEEQHRKLNAAPLPTTARVETARSVHAYWKLDGAVPLDAWHDTQRRLIAFLDGDKSIKNASRVMRAPGFDHVSQDGTRTPVKVVQFDPERVYTIAEMLAAFPPAASRETKRHDRQNHTSSGYATWDALRAELGRRIVTHETARRNAAGKWDCRGICHDGEGDTGLFYDPFKNQIYCNSD